MHSVLSACTKVLQLNSVYKLVGKINTSLHIDIYPHISAEAPQRFLEALIDHVNNEDREDGVTIRDSIGRDKK